MIGRCAFVGAAICIAALGFTGSMAAAAPSPQVSSGATVSCRWNEKTTFPAILEDLASQAHVTFVAEGKPLHPELIHPLSDKFSSGAGPLNEVVAEVAFRFDFDAQRKGNIFYLTKRYSRPDDLPSVTVEECRQSLIDIVRASSRFNPRVPLMRLNGDNLFDSFVRSLSPEQVKQLPPGLPATQIDDSQTVMLQKIEYNYYVQETVSTLEAALKRLEGMQQADSNLILAEIKGNQLCGISTVRVPWICVLSLLCFQIKAQHQTKQAS